MSNSKIRILDVLPALNVDSGVASYEMNYLRGLDHNNYLVDVAIFADYDTPYYDELKSYGGNIYLIPPLKHLFRHIRECKRVFDNTHYDIVHNNTLSKSVFLSLFASIYGIKARILHSHSAQLGDNIKKQILNRLVVSFLRLNSNHLVACSKAAANCYFGNREYVYVPNVIDSEKYVFDYNKRNSIRKQYNSDDKIILCTVGRLSSEKNPFFALDIVKNTINRIPQLEYWWIGTGSLAEKVKEYAVQIGIQDKVVFWGEQTNLPDFYQAIDIFLLPSFFEGMPLTCIEAQAMGVQCVVSSSITKEVVFSDLVHFVSINEDSEIWAKTISSLVKNIQSRQGYSDALCKSDFSNLTAGKRLMDYYDSIVQL